MFRLADSPCLGFTHCLSNVSSYRRPLHSPCITSELWRHGQGAAVPNLFPGGYLVIRPDRKPSGMPCSAGETKWNVSRAMNNTSSTGVTAEAAGKGFSAAQIGSLMLQNSLLFRLSNVALFLGSFFSSNLQNVILVKFILVTKGKIGDDTVFWMPVRVAETANFC